jgi:hypothetical protein
VLYHVDIFHFFIKLLLEGHLNLHDLPELCMVQVAAFMGCQALCGAHNVLDLPPIQFTLCEVKILLFTQIRAVVATKLAQEVLPDLQATAGRQLIVLQRNVDTRSCQSVYIRWHVR